MKKVIYLLLITLTLVLSSCVKNTTAEVSVIAPSGTPALGLADFFKNASEEVKYEIVSGSDPLVAAFTSESHDIIVAPVNLGARFYNTNKSYLLYKTFVWGNTYIASTEEINSIKDLEGKDITAFGETSTPGIVLKSLLSYMGVNANVTYVSDVATANASLLTGKSNIILTAEPSLSNIKTKKTLYTLDLQSVWMEMTNSYSYPQAAIFVKASMKNNVNVKSTLNKMISAVTNAIENPEITSKNACTIDETFSKLGEEILKAAIPNCHFNVTMKDKEAVEFYFNKLNSLGLSKMYGGTLPDEGFYIN